MADEHEIERLFARMQRRGYGVIVCRDRLDVALHMRAVNSENTLRQAFKQAVAGRGGDWCVIAVASEDDREKLRAKVRAYKAALDTVP